MRRAGPDEMSNDTLEARAALAVLAEAAVASWAIARGDASAVVALNQLVAIALLIAIVPRLMSFRILAEDFVRLLVALLVFELAILATSLFWFAYPRLAWLAWTEFSIHALLSLAFLIFVFTFRFTRLI